MKTKIIVTFAPLKQSIQRHAEAKATDYRYPFLKNNIIPFYLIFQND